MKLRKRALLLSVIAAFSLVGCKGGGEPVVTTYMDATPNSIYGKLDFTGAKSAKDVVPGDVITFKVTPSKYFLISEVTNNGVECTRVDPNENNEDGSLTYSTTIVEGQNIIKGSYVVDETIDFVDEYKLNIDPDVYEYIMAQKETDGDKVKADKNGLDFRKSGIEQCRAPNAWEKQSDGTYKKVERSTDDVFVNYVDGDTTHVETNNLKYTVKIRYLSIDTPESTSDIEEWGLSASNYSKYIYSGHEEYRKAIEGTTDFTGVQAGVTSLILVSQAASIHSSEITMEDLGLGGEEEGIYHATTDNNQRNLAYVWYSTATPDEEGKIPQSSFRCLNLEMVYQGFSFGVGSMDDTSEEIYKIFDAANLSAKAHKRHLFSDLDDNNYYYYERSRYVQDLELKDLYESATKNSTIGWLPESRLADKKTLFRVHGYVSRKVGTSFYIQEKTSYTREEVLAGQAFGIYVFTYSETPIKAGDEVSVVGALNGYGGSFQIQGVVYHDIDPDPVRDTKIISSGNTVTPVKVTGKEFNELKLPNILVEITDNLWFYDFQTTYDGEITSLGEGGSDEVNKYNESYPFYNTSNSPIFYASYGAYDNARELNESTKTSSSGLRYSDKVIRFTVDQNILVRYGVESALSYQFFTGGQYFYNEKGAEYANDDADNPYKEYSILKTFVRKAALYDPTDAASHGLIVVSHGYESTGGNRKMTATICSGSYSDVSLVVVED